MRCLYSLLLLFALAVCGSACAQDRIELYGTAALAHVSEASTGVAATSSGYQPQYTSLTKVGLGGGFTVNVLQLPLFSLGLDANGFTRGNTNGLDDGLLGLKAGLRLPHLRIKPWVEGAAGFLSVHAANVSPLASGQATTDGRITSHFSVYQFTGGVDYPIAHHFDVRVLSVGGGSSFGASPNTSLLTLNSGVVIHF